MAKKASDFLKKIDERHPHMTLDVEFAGEEVPLVLRNYLRLDDEEQAEVSEAMNILQLMFVKDDDDIDAEELLKELLTEEEMSQNFTRVYVERIVRALRAAAEDKDLYDEFIEGSRKQLGGDFKQFIVTVYNAYQEETRLGEAEGSGNS